MILEVNFGNNAVFKNKTALKVRTCQHTLREFLSQFQNRTVKNLHLKIGDTCYETMVLCRKMVYCLLGFAAPSEEFRYLKQR